MAASRRLDLASGLVWVVLGAAMTVGSISLRLGRFDDPGPGLMPFLVGLALALSGAILILSSVAPTCKARQNGDSPLAGTWTKGASILGASWLYVLLLEPLGFVIASGLFLFASVQVLGVRRLSVSVLFTAATVAASYLLFVVWLHLRLPRGVLEFG